jgi:ER lumen protein retaining receptor
MILNEFRLVGDFLHGFAILLLIFHIIKTRSCHSVCGLTIILYTITFLCRYLDLFEQYIFLSSTVLIYNNIFKIYYLLSNFFLLFLIYGLFRKTRDKLHETFPIFGYFIIAHILTWGTCYFTGHKEVDKELFWRFSIYLEMFAIIPQLSLIYKQGIISKTMTYYLMMLGSYRAFYILNWIYRYNTEHFLEPIGFFGGCIQTIIYLHFFVHIYPRLNNGNKYQVANVTKDFIKIIDMKEDINQTTKHDIPLIHTGV